MSDNLMTVSIDKVIPSRIDSLRGVDTNSEDFQLLLASIRKRKYVAPISVREYKDPEKGLQYEILDGLQRYTAAKLAGLDEIGIQVRNMDDNEALLHQIISNVHRIETKPVEYTRALRRVLDANRTMTLNELADSICHSPEWLKKRLKLLDIQSERLSTLIDEGSIPLNSAYAIANIPDAAVQEEMLDDAITMKVEEFVPMAEARAKEIKEARRQGREVKTTFEPRPTFRKLSEIRHTMEIDSSELEALVKSNDLKNPIDAVRMGVQWTIQMDPESQRQQIEKWEQYQSNKRANLKAAQDKRQQSTKLKKLQNALTIAQETGNSDLEAKLQESIDTLTKVEAAHD